MTEVPKPLDTALDLLVFAPVGLAMTAAEELPKLAAKGRTRVNTQFMMARVVGQFAVAKGRQELEKRFAPPAPPADPSPAVTEDGPQPPVTFDEMTANGTAPAAPGRSPEVPEGLPGADRTEVAGGVAVSTAGDLASVTPLPGTAPASSPAEALESPSVTELAIPGYDSLSASQVVQRLAGLSGEELQAVGAYEHTHRGRRTILNRIDQLQGH